MHPMDRTLAQILETEGKIDHYCIPKYQREYMWGKNEWDQLLVDIKRNGEGYFMGSIICINDNDVPAVPQRPLIFELVDGQQRLTTISILLMSIYRKLKCMDKDSLSEEEKEGYQFSLSSIKKRLIYRTDSVNAWERERCFVDDNDKNKYCFPRLRPSTQGTNYDDYLYILRELDLINKRDFRSPNCGNRRLYKAYKHFLKETSDEYEGLMGTLDIINSLRFISITVPSSRDAFILFESLNNRGIPLAAMDIIKNKILSRLKGKHDMNIDAAYGKWQELLKYLPEYRDQERFLRQYHNAFPKVEKEHTKATRGTLIKIYERRIEKDAVATIDDLVGKARIYNTFIKPESNKSEDRKRYFHDLNRIGSASSYLFLLYLYGISPEKIEDRERTIDEILRFFIKYYVRRNITDFPNTHSLDTINMRIIERCEDHIRQGNEINGQFIINSFIGNKSYTSGISKFKEVLSDNLYASNAEMARFVLTKLDEEHHSREYNPNFWVRNSNRQYVWTIEHIFPQSRNITQPWSDMIAGGDIEKAKEIRENYVHCLGNLTLSGYNSRLSNREFTEKQNCQTIESSGHKIRVGYKNGLALNNLPFSVHGEETNLARIDKWTEESIKARNARIVGDLLEIFSFSKDEMRELMDDE